MCSTLAAARQLRSEEQSDSCSLKLPTQPDRVGGSFHFFPELIYLMLLILYIVIRAY